MHTALQQESFSTISAPVQLTLELEFSFWRASFHLKDTLLAVYAGEMSSPPWDCLPEKQLSQVYVYVWPGQHTVVPSSLWQTDQRETYLSQLYSSGNNDLVKTEKLEHLSLHTIYTVTPATQLSIIKHYPGAQFLNPVSQLISQLADHTEHALLAHQTHDQLWVIAIRERHLLLCNHYTCKAPEDRLYYISHVCDSLKFSFDNIQLSGAWSAQDLALLEKYFKHVEHINWGPETLEHGSEYNIVTTPHRYAHH